MIEYADELVPDAVAVALKLWMGKPEAHTLLRIVNAHVQREQCLALTDAVKSKDFEALSAKVNDHMRNAQRFQTFIDVWNQVNNEQSPYAYVKLH